MGQVYRARDTRLNRDVALKVLPDSFAHDPDRLARFSQEAQVLAALNHPNIAHVHGLEEDGGVVAIVMEFVDGEDLAQRLRSGPLPLDEALAAAAQMADGLEAAHERGIVHRDIKPANIKLTPAGVVKILDFGLAKALTSDALGAPATIANSPTIASPARTGAGVILGTAAYMSPEQARGKAIDKRSDIWAFGCVVYEMLSGVPAFGGETTTDVLAAVIQRDVDWSKLQADVPGRIVTLLRRCLERNPKDRLRDIGDARFEIAEARKHGDDRAAAPAAAAPRTGVKQSSAAAIALGFAAGAAAAAAVAFVVIGGSRTAKPAAAAAIRAIVTLPPDTSLTLSRGSAVALSPDGRLLVYSGAPQGRTQLYRRALDRFESLPIAGTDNGADPFFSPDGQWVGFFADGKMKKVSLDGGAPVVVADAPQPRGEAWGGDNVMLMTPQNNRAVSRVSALGGTPEAATTLASGELSHRWPRVLPDGKTIIFTVWNDIGWEPARIAVQRPDSKEHQVVLPSGGGFPPVRRRRILAVRFSDLWTLGWVDGRALRYRASGDHESGHASARQPEHESFGRRTHFDVSANGTLAYVAGASGESDRELAWVTRDGKATPALRIHDMSRFWELSPDGARILRNNTSGPGKDLWIDDLARGTNTHVTTQESDFSGPWSRDGKSIAFSRGAPIANLYRRVIDSDTDERLTTSPLGQTAEDFSPDGSSLAFMQFDPVTGSDIWILTLATRATRPFIATRFTERYPRFSPDGRWIAYDSNESGRFEVYVRAYPEGVRKWAISTDGGVAPTWAPDGREILYRTPAGKLMAAAIDGRAADFRSEPARMLFDATGYELTYSISPDGKRFLMMPLMAPEAAPTQIHIVVNWIDELRQRVK